MGTGERSRYIKARKKDRLTKDTEKPRQVVDFLRLRPSLAPTSLRARSKCRRALLASHSVVIYVWPGGEVYVCTAVRAAIPLRSDQSSIWGFSLSRHPASKIEGCFGASVEAEHERTGSNKIRCFVGFSRVHVQRLSPTALQTLWA